MSLSLTRCPGDTGTGCVCFLGHGGAGSSAIAWQLAARHRVQAKHINGQYYSFTALHYPCQIIRYYVQQVVKRVNCM